MGCFRIKLFGQLLGNGRATACTLLSQNATLNDGTPQGDKIDAGMVVKANILGSHQRFHQRRGQLGIIYHDAVFTIIVPCTHNLAIGRNHLRGKTVNGVLQFLNGRHISYPAIVNSRKAQGTNDNTQSQQNPQTTYNYLFHRISFSSKLSAKLQNSF